MYKHSELLALCTSMQLQVDEIVTKSKLSTLRNSFDFRHAMNKMMENDNIEVLEHMIFPMLPIKVKVVSADRNGKSFELENRNEEESELITEGEESAYVYEDEAEEQRISENFDLIVKILFEKLETEHSFSLSQLNEELMKILEKKYC